MLKIILSENEIKDICKRITKQLEDKFKNQNDIPVFIGVLKGALPFMMDIMKQYSLPCIMDFIQVSSYEGTSSSGKITLKKDVSENLKGKNIIIIEDIVDTGITMNYLTEYFYKKHQVKSITTVSLLDKKVKRIIPFDVDIIGKEIPDEFVMGYGFDYNDLARNSNCVYVPTKEEIENFEMLSKKL